jgi:3-deoxy-D-manno-octulosonic-acid transferase
MHPPPDLPPTHRDPLWLAYRAALLLLSPVWVLYAAWRLFLGRSREGRPERFGGGRKLPPPPPPPGLRAWFHGVSVGETEAMAPVIGAVRDATPDIRAEIVVSATTVTGRARAEALHPDVLERRFTPLDLPWTTARALRRIQPTVLVLGESELWPSLLQQTASRAPVVLVNARLSDRTMPRARRLRPFYRWMLRRLTAVGVQTAEDRDRFEELGLDPARITVTGNTKFDRQVPTLTPEDRARLRAELGIGDAPLLVAGSTFPGEDEVMLDALDALRGTGTDPEAPGRGTSWADLRLLLAPRHPGRADAVEALVRERGYRVWRRSRGPAGPEDPDVVILDTVGELASLYALGHVAVVGRSFRMGGGQNPLEPMAHGVPVVYGPRMENFRQIARQAEEGGAALRCAGEEALVPTLARILHEPGLHAAMAEAGPRILEEHRGAAERSARLVIEAARTGGPRARRDANPPPGPTPETPPGKPPPPGSRRDAARIAGLLPLLGVACTAGPPDTMGSLEAGLSPCPATDSCVHTGDGYPEGTEPVLLTSEWASRPGPALAVAVADAVRELDRTEVIGTRTGGDEAGGALFLHAEATSRIFRFVDDLEVFRAHGSDELVVRSASRVGRSDLGVNARRVEDLRTLLVERGVIRR